MLQVSRGEGSFLCCWRSFNRLLCSLILTPCGFLLIPALAVLLAAACMYPPAPSCPRCHLAPATWRHLKVCWGQGCALAAWCAYAWECFLCWPVCTCVLVCDRNQVVCRCLSCNMVVRSSWDQVELEGCLFMCAELATLRQPVQSYICGRHWFSAMPVKKMMCTPVLSRFADSSGVTVSSPSACRHPLLAQDHWEPVCWLAMAGRLRHQG